jgi:hypothetical protein
MARPVLSSTLKAASATVAQLRPAQTRKAISLLMPVLMRDLQKVC